MKSFRRDKLRRLVEAGKVVMAGSYHFDDMTGESRSQGQAMPVAMYPDGPDGWRQCKPGICYVRPFEFTTKSGCCYVRDDTIGIVTLIVHGNSNYDFRIVP